MLNLKSHSDEWGFVPNLSSRNDGTSSTPAHWLTDPLSPRLLSASLSPAVNRTIADPLFLALPDRLACLVGGDCGIGRLR